MALFLALAGIGHRIILAQTAQLHVSPTTISKIGELGKAQKSSFPTVCLFRCRDGFAFRGDFWGAVVRSSRFADADPLLAAWRMGHPLASCLLVALPWA